MTPRALNVSFTTPPTDVSAKVLSLAVMRALDDLGVVVRTVEVERVPE